MWQKVLENGKTNYGPPAKQRFHYFQPRYDDYLKEWQAAILFNVEAQYLFSRESYLKGLRQVGNLWLSATSSLLCARRTQKGRWP